MSHISLGPIDNGVLLPVKIDLSGSGDQTLVAAATSGNQPFLIACYKLFLVVGAATNLTFKDGATALTGAIPLAINGSITLDLDGTPWFATTQVANALILNSSAGVQISGTLYVTKQLKQGT